MSKLIMLVGVAGSGKSTYANKYYSDMEIFSSDKIREELYGDASIQDNPMKVFNILHHRIATALKNGKDVVYDATNLSMKKRMGFLKQYGYFADEKHCIVLITPLKECCRRQQTRERRVPYEVIKKQICRFQCPDYYEGWDTIEIIQDSTCTTILEDFLERNDFDQENSHHSLTAKEHMLAAAEFYKSDYKDDVYTVLLFALKYHDIGKFFTKTFKDKKGKSTIEAHYYEHQNAGAYFMLQCCEHELLMPIYHKAAVLIQWHMEFFLRNEVGMERLFNLLGKELSEQLKLLHEYDRRAH